MHALMMLRVWKEMLTMWGAMLRVSAVRAEGVQGDADNVGVRC